MLRSPAAQKRASVLLPLRSLRTLARISTLIASCIIQKSLFRSVTSNKKDCKGNPRSVPCKGPSALRVRPVKISTAGKDEPAAHLPQEGGGRIFTDSTLTSPVPGACKQSFFIFLSFFGFFFLFLFSGNNHKRGAVRWFDAFSFATLFL